MFFSSSGGLGVFNLESETNAATICSTLSPWPSNPKSAFPVSLSSKMRLSNINETALVWSKRLCIPQDWGVAQVESNLLKDIISKKASQK